MNNIPFLVSLLVLINIQILNAQVLIDANGTMVGGITPLPSLTTPFISIPNQDPDSNYWPIWVRGPIHFQTPPSLSGMIMEDFENNFVSNDGQNWTNSNPNVGTGTTIYNEPILRGGWANTAWLGNPYFPFWQIYSQEIWAQGGMFLQSDQRLKINIANHPSAINKIMQLRPVVYDKIDINENTPEEKREILNNGMKNQHGFLAQELLEVYPEFVSVDDKGFYGVNYIELVSVLVKAMQELPIAIGKAQIDSLKQIVGE